MALTSKQLELLRDFANAGGIDVVFGAVELVLGAEWRGGVDVEARELSHAKYLALRDVRREIRKLIGQSDDGS